MTTPGLVADFFRHQYAGLVASLTRRAGPQHLQLAEDAAQSALLTALESWPRAGEPDEPAAWLYRVALHQLLDDLRRDSRHRRLLEQNIQPTLCTELKPSHKRMPGEINDDLLRMLFVCCQDTLPFESQLCLALKVLCGFGVLEIAARLFISTANVYKRLSRARNALRDLPEDIFELTPEQLRARLDPVHTILYLIFTEGYLSTRAEASIREELCHEALRLTTALSEHPAGQGPTTDALLALMYLHLARLGARRDATGGLLLLEEQDRSCWDPRAIERGMILLARSARGDQFSRYHAEAAVAAEHCMAERFELTNWERVAACYAQLERSAPSPLHRLNRAVALAQHQGPQAGLDLLDEAAAPPWLVDSYQWAAVRADLLRRLGHTQKAKEQRQRALEQAPNEATRRLLERRLQIDP